MFVRRRGSALAVLLLVLVLLVVFLAGVVALGAHHARTVYGNLRSVAAVQAAEAGLHKALVELSRTHTWTLGYTNEHLGGELDPTYTVVVVNNLAGAGPVSGPDGLSVPAGLVLLHSTGTCGDVSRRVAVFLGSGLRFGYAIAAGGGMTLSAAGTVQGSLKSTQDLDISARVEVQPVQGQGRVLCGGNLTVQGGLVEQPGQDCRARGTITGESKISGASPIVAHDTSDDTNPFLMDGRTTNDPPAGQEVMPNPDLSVLLAAGAYVNHPGFTRYGGGNKTLDLGGQVHYFPDGVTFGSGSQIVGEGIIVVGNGNSAIFDIPLDHHMDVVVLDSEPGGPGGDPGEIQFNRSTRIQGLVYCQGNVYAKADFRVDGRVITYGDGKFVHTGAHVEAVLNLATVTCPGFDAFFGAGAGPLGMGISAWQRL